MLAQHRHFSGVFQKLELRTFRFKNRAHSKLVLKILAGIFEIQTFKGNIAFPTGIGLTNTTYVSQNAVRVVT